MLLLAVSALAAGPAHAWYPTFRIEELHSSEDGMEQYIVLRESFDLDGQCYLAGRTLVSMQGPEIRVFTFPSNLPDPHTARRYVLIATPAFAKRGLVRPDYVVSAPFLFPDGGVLNFAGVDALSYPALPTSSLLSLNRFGGKGVRSPVNFEGETKFRSTQTLHRYMLC